MKAERFAGSFLDAVERDDIDMFMDILSIPDGARGKDIESFLAYWRQAAMPVMSSLRAARPELATSAGGDTMVRWPGVYFEERPDATFEISVVERDGELRIE